MISNLVAPNRIRETQDYRKFIQCWQDLRKDISSKVAGAVDNPSRCLPFVDKALINYNPGCSKLELSTEAEKTPRRRMSTGHPDKQHDSSAYDMGQSLWQSCVDQLAQELPEQQFNTWIKPLLAQVEEDFSKVTIFVANRFKLDWIRAQYGGKISALLERLYGQPVQVELAITPREIAVRPVFAKRAVDVLAVDESVDMVDDRNAGLPKNRLNSMLTFDTLVEGTANRMARAAAMHVATMPGHMYNPLFIYGGVGLGKTHLMHAVGNCLLADKPNSKVLYIHAEQFVSDVVKAYQRKIDFITSAHLS